MRIQRERESWADAILQGLAFLVCGALYIFALLVFLPGCSDAQPRDPPVVEDYCACMTQDDLQGLKEVGEVNTRLMDTIGRLEERIQVLEERVMARPEPEPVSFQEPEAPEEDDGGMEEPIPDYGGEIQSVREDVQEANEYTSREIAAVNSRLDSLEGRQGVTPAQLNEVRSALSTLADQYHNPVQTWRTPYNAGGEGGELILCGDTTTPNNTCWHIDVSNARFRVFKTWTEGGRSQAREYINYQ